MDNINLKWWQVLGFFVVFAGIIWFKVARKENFEAKDVEARVDALRVEACQCPSQECADAVGKKLSDYMEEVGDRETTETQAGYITGLAAGAMRCVSDAEARADYSGTGFSMDTALEGVLEAQPAAEGVLEEAPAAE